MLQHTAAAALTTRHMGMLILPHHTTLEPIPALGHQWPVARCYRRPPAAAPPLPPPPLPLGSSQVGCLRLGGDLLGGGGGALPEAVLEAPGHGLEVTAAASARGLSPLGLLAPVDCTTQPTAETADGVSDAPHKEDGFSCHEWEGVNKQAAQGREVRSMDGYS